MWVEEDGIRYNNENPVVCDEYWDNGEYYDEYADPDEYDATPPAFKIFYYGLDDEETKLFKADLQEVAESCEEVPDLAWDDMTMTVIVTGWLTEDEAGDFWTVYGEKYDLRAEELVAQKW